MQLSRLRRINPIVMGVVFFVIGIILVITAIAIDPNHVTCNGQTMNRGDTCIHSFNGAATSRNTIDQQRQSQQSTRILEIIGALLCLGVGTSLFIFRLNKARAALKKNPLNTASQPEAEADLPLQKTNPQQTAVLPSLPTGTHPSLPTRAPQQTGVYPSLLTGTHPSLPSRAPQQTGTYPSLLTGTFPSLPSRDLKQSDSHPSLQKGDTQQPKAYDNPQPKTTAQFRAYRPVSNDQSQSDANLPPDGN